MTTQPSPGPSQPSDGRREIVRRAMHAAMMRHDPSYPRPASWDKDADRLLAVLDASFPVIALSDLANALQSDEVVEAAAKGLFTTIAAPVTMREPKWENCPAKKQAEFREEARAALLAAYSQIRVDSEQ